MKLKTADALKRMREVELNLARRALAEALAAEEQARATGAALDAQILSETDIARQSADDQDVERFAAWLKGARRRLQRAEAACAEATATTAHKRAELTLVRAAAEAAGQAVDTCARQRQGERERRAQADLSGYDGRSRYQMPPSDE